MVKNNFVFNTKINFTLIFRLNPTNSHLPGDFYKIHLILCSTMGKTAVEMNRAQVSNGELACGKVQRHES